MKTLIYISTAVFLFISSVKQAQVPAPATKQQKQIVLKNGTIHDGNLNVLQNQSLLIEQGKILQIGAFDKLEYNTDAEIINLEGKHIYPGLIMPVSQLGLTEIGAVRASNDTRERGTINASVRSIVAYNTDSELIPTIRSNGVMIAQVIPAGGLISGTSSVVQLDAWNWEDAVVAMDNVLHLNWPSKYASSWQNNKPLQKNKNYNKQVQTIKKFFTDAIAYHKMKNPEKTNLHFEAVKELLNGEMKLFISATAPAEIIESVLFAKECGIQDIVLTGIDEKALEVKDFIKEHELSVILGELHSLPSKEDEDGWIKAKLPAIFYKENIKTAISVSWLPISMNYAFKAASAAAYGLTKEETLQLITKNPAEMLGINQKLGTIETGKDATIVVSNGDILDIATNDIVLAFIDGRKIDLDNRHKYLYRKYQQKYD